MKPSSVIIHSTLATLQTAAQTLLQQAGLQKIWLFEGEVGAGKTTLIKAFCAQLGVLGHVNSPTFSLVHEYATIAGETVYHFDFYRIHQEEEALAMDLLAYLESGSYCFIEWPTKVHGLIPPKHAHMHVAPQPDGSRMLQLSLHGEVA